MSASFSRQKVLMGKRDKAFYAGSVVVLLAAILAYTYPSIHMVHKVYLKQKLKADIRAELKEQNRLRVRYEMLVSHREMERLAREMGFTEPDMEKIIYVMKER